MTGTTQDKGGKGLHHEEATGQTGLVMGELELLGTNQILSDKNTGSYIAPQYQY